MTWIAPRNVAALSLAFSRLKVAPSNFFVSLNSESEEFISMAEEVRGEGNAAAVGLAQRLLGDVSLTSSRRLLQVRHVAMTMSAASRIGRVLPELFNEVRKGEERKTRVGETSEATKCCEIYGEERSDILPFSSYFTHGFRSSRR